MDVCTLEAPLLKVRSDSEANKAPHQHRKANGSDPKQRRHFHSSPTQCKKPEHTKDDECGCSGAFPKTHCSHTHHVGTSNSWYAWFLRPQKPTPPVGVSDVRGIGSAFGTRGSSRGGGLESLQSGSSHCVQTMVTEFGVDTTIERRHRPRGSPA